MHTLVFKRQSIHWNYLRSDKLLIIPNESHQENKIIRLE